MRRRVGTRTAKKILGGVVLGLTLVGAAICERSPTGIDDNQQICYLIDGQVYCYPSSGADSLKAQPEQAIP